MKIRIYEIHGRIGATYDAYDDDRDDKEDLCGLMRFCEDIEALFSGDIGLVPKDVQAQGEFAIRAFAEEACRTHHRDRLRKARERYTAVNLRADTVNRRIQAEHHGMVLHGRIKCYGMPGRFTVKLKKPFAFKKFVFDFNNRGGRLPNPDVFDWMTGELKEDVLKEAQAGLIRLYNVGLSRGRRPKALQ